mmetsp:Transcript_38913/g.91062  ORF Transcript_38913/g.91062 Transcript_38913/m.91062 type:complete len:254 (-) Transcript_38913:582-1343(-)
MHSAGKDGAKAVRHQRSVRTVRLGGQFQASRRKRELVKQLRPVGKLARRVQHLALRVRHRPLRHKEHVGRLQLVLRRVDVHTNPLKRRRRLCRLGQTAPFRQKLLLVGAAVLAEEHLEGHRVLEIEHTHVVLHGNLEQEVGGRWGGGSRGAHGQRHRLCRPRVDLRHLQRLRLHEAKGVLVELDGKAGEGALGRVRDGQVEEDLAVATHDAAVDGHALALGGVEEDLADGGGGCRRRASPEKVPQVVQQRPAP